MKKILAIPFDQIFTLHLSEAELIIVQGVQNEEGDDSVGQPAILYNYYTMQTL